MVDGLEGANGMWPGFRRNHAKGVCIAGRFDSNGQGVRLSKAAVFRPGQVPVIGRLSLSGGQPYAADGPAAVPGTVRSMALAVRPTDGEEWRVAMLDIPVFIVADPGSFYQLLVASRPEPATGKPDVAKIQDFVAHHPETARALETVRASTFSSGFANASYHSL